jgi:hypothetical protein
MNPRTTRDKRFAPRLGAHPNFASLRSAKLLLSRNVVQNRSLRSLTILHNGRRFPSVGSSLAQLATIAQLTAIRHVGLMTLSSFRHDRIAAAHYPECRGVPF